jgi:hypothetical protein
MTKKPFIVFGLVLVFLAVLIPLWAFTTDGDPAKGRMEVPENLKKGQTLFDTNCGTCHTLYAAGTDGDFGPNLDQQLAPAGTDTGPGAADTMDGIRPGPECHRKGYDDDLPGRMPAGIVVGPGESIAARPRRPDAVSRSSLRLSAAAFRYLSPERGFFIARRMTSRRGMAGTHDDTERDEQTTPRDHAPRPGHGIHRYRRGIGKCRTSNFAVQQEAQGHPSVMTRNVYLRDLGPRRRDHHRRLHRQQRQILRRRRQRLPLRAKGPAAEILRGTDLVIGGRALADRSGRPSHRPPGTYASGVKYDYLRILMDRLNRARSATAVKVQNGSTSKRCRHNAVPGTQRARHQQQRQDQRTPDNARRSGRVGAHTTVNPGSANCSTL